MKTADQILSCTSDYELKELRARLSDPIIQPRDAIEAMHQFATQAVEQRDKQLEPLIYAMNGYITVLGKELDDCALLLSSHGWQSNRVQEGIDARNKIIEIQQFLKTNHNEKYIN